VHDLLCQVLLFRLHRDASYRVNGEEQKHGCKADSTQEKEGPGG
jgi:hypothetical protein